MTNDSRTRTITWSDPKISARDADSITGLDYLAAIVAGRIPPPPVARLIGYKMVSVAFGHAVFRLEPEEYLYNPFATLHGGVISTLLDSAMAAAVLSTLPLGAGCATNEFKMNFFRPVTARTGTLTCEARPVHLGRGLATAEGYVEDAAGKRYAQGLCSCSIFGSKKAVV